MISSSCHFQHKFNQLRLKRNNAVVVFVFLAFIFKKKMVGSIHPMGFTAGISARDLKLYPLYDLVRIVWDKYRCQEDHLAVCPVCRHVEEWCLDLIWSKWNHKSYIVYNEFVYRLIHTNSYDNYMNEVSSETMLSIDAFLGGIYPQIFFFKYIIVN